MQAKTMPNPAFTTGQLIAAIESNNVKTAIRFERGVFNAITNRGQNPIIYNIIKSHHCSTDTARVLYSTSFGKYQLMGFNLWGKLSLTCTYFDYLNDDSLQDKSFQDFLVMNGIMYEPQDLCDPKKRERFAKIYNGSIKYMGLIKRQLLKNGFSVA